ncbi:MAG: AzlD domain-containing protein [Synergistaceae bacterium]|nr:AzlD domain-containing protein [Synergistaceae bacterium]
MRAGGGGAGATVPKILASLTVIVLHVWRRNTLLSTLAGTGLYMFLVQCVF